MERNQYITEEDDFFKFEKPCPDRIPRCRELRERFLNDKQDIEKILGTIDLTKLSCCSSADSMLKEKYINIIASMLNEDNSTFDTDFEYMNWPGFEGIKKIYETR
jgi:hypothetical protein